MLLAAILEEIDTAQVEGQENAIGGRRSCPI